MTSLTPLVDDDLRDVGLDSIRLMSLLSSLRATGTVIELGALTAEPTLRGLATALERARAGRRPSS